ncbi:MAG: endonuclease [archaeon]
MNQIQKIYGILYKEFKSQGWWPVISKDGKNHQFEISIGAILTQNTSWSNVEKVIKILDEKNLLNKNSFKKIDTEELALLIRSSGYYNQKAKKIKAFIEFLDSNKEISRINLLKVYGLGKETVDSILLYSYNQPVFVIDAYTKRVFSRLKLCNKDIDYDKLQFLFESNLDKNIEVYKEYHALIVNLGKNYCKTKPLCEKCCLRKICPKDIS